MYVVCICVGLCHLHVKQSHKNTRLVHAVDTFSLIIKVIHTCICGIVLNGLYPFNITCNNLKTVSKTY